MTLSFAAEGNTVTFDGSVYSTEATPERAGEWADALNAALLRVLAAKGKDPKDNLNSGKPSKSNPDPDGDGDDDTSAKGDTDNDFFPPKNKKDSPPKKAQKSDDGEDD